MKNFLILIVMVTFTSCGSRPTTTSTSEKGFFGNDSFKTSASRILASLEDLWGKEFANAGITYRNPKLVLVNKEGTTGCGKIQLVAYCKVDQQIILANLNTWPEQFRPQNEFALGYALAHEVGHHVQKLVHILDQLDGPMRSDTHNAISRKIEQQADFFAGIWAQKGNGSSFTIEDNDIDGALRFVSSIGDDSVGNTNPAEFTHGTAAARKKAFLDGLNSADLDLVTMIHYEPGND